MKCAQSIAAVSKTLTEYKDQLALLEEVNNRIESIQKNQPTMSRTEAAEVARGQIKKNLAEANLIAHRNALLNIMRRSEIMEGVQSFIKGTGKDDPANALATMLVGSSERGFSSRRSIDATAKTIRAEFSGTLINALDRTGYMELATSGALDREIARELWELRDGGSPGSSNSKEALAIAKIVKESQREMVDRLNGVGAWIKEEPGYIIRQSHDRAKMMKAGRDKWAQDISQALDWNRISENFDVATPERRQQFLDGIFDNLTLGREIQIGSGPQTKNPLGFAFTGPGNMAKSISAERVLHFTDADTFWNYHTEYGGGRLLDSVFASLQKAAGEIALMDRFGTNPKYMFDRIRAELANEYRGKDEKVRGRLTGRAKIDTLTLYMRELTGEAREVGDVSLAQIGSSIRAVQSMSKLGMATLSSFGDVASTASELHYHGIGYLQSYGNSLRSLGKGLGDGEYKEMMRLVGVGLESMRGEMFTRMHGNDLPHGMIAKGLETFFKLNGLNWWTDCNKAAVAHMLSTNLANHAKFEFSKLDPHLTNVLTQYGINAREWDLIRKHSIGDVQGNRFALVDKLAAIPDAEIKAAVADLKGIAESDVTPHIMDRYRNDLETSLRMYYLDSADYAVPTPGARENALLNMGTKRGTVLGEATRFVMQFKSFPMTFLTKAYEREFVGRANWQDRLAPVVHTIIATTLMGYLSTVAKEAIQGKSPRDAFGEDWKEIWMKAALQGGGLGIYGDFLFAETNKYGNSQLVAELGPTFASAELVYKTFGAVRDAAIGAEHGDWNTAAETAYKAGIQHIPFANLFYLRTALNYSIFWNIQEALNPGSLGRMERNAAKEGQTYWLKPTEALFQ